jgi:DnaJ domain
MQLLFAEGNTQVWNMDNELTLYEELCVPETASAEEIDQAYYRRTQEFYPDLNEGDTWWLENLKRIYDTLSDEAKRRAYDQKLAETRGETGDQPGADPQPWPTGSSPQSYRPQIPWFQPEPQIPATTPVATTSHRSVQEEVLVVSGELVGEVVRSYFELVGPIFFVIFCFWLFLEFLKLLLS